MTPETIKAIQESAIFNEFAKYLAEEVMKLDKLNDIKIDGNTTIKVAGRKYAFELITEILEPLIKVEEYAIITSGEEYAVDVPEDKPKT